MILGLFIKAELNNVDILKPIPGIYWKFDITHPTGYEYRNNVYCSSSERYSMPNSRGEANLIIKWTDSESRASLVILEEGVSYTVEDQGKYKCVAKFDVRGLEIRDWYPEDGFEAERNGKTYPVEFQDNSWADYDLDTSEPLSVLDLEYRIQQL